jgi:dTDP-4-amino-4,6-dideoxygalactose transaminase
MTETKHIVITSSSTEADTTLEQIHLSSPDVGLLEEQAVMEALHSGWVAPAGPDLTAFEEEVAQRVGVDHAVALSSGTAALHLGLLALGVGPGDVVVTSTLTFAATANAIVYTGAEPFFIDVDPATGNMDPELLDIALHVLARANKRVGAVLPVDLLGKAANYTAIDEIAANYDVPVLADAAEAFGAYHAGSSAGSFADAAVFSFNGNKIMTTSSGGMLVTNRAEVAQYVRYLSTQARQPVAHYEHTDIGYNYRLSNLLAALGRAQLQRLDAMIARRREVRERYRQWCTTQPGIEILGGATDQDDNCWLTPLIFDQNQRPVAVETLIQTLANHRIEARRIWKPMHLQPVFADARSLLTGAAEELFDNGVILPSGSNMTGDQLARVVNALDAYLGEPRS